MTDRFGWLLAAIALVLCLPLVGWDRLLEPDAASMYAPMVREFGAGNFDRAFCPLIPPLLTLVGGPLCLLGLDAFTAAKLASVLFFAAGTPLVYALHRRYLSVPTAQLATVLYVVCSLYLREAAKGLLDPGKVLFLLVTTYGLVVFGRSRGWRAAGLVGLGGAGLSLARAEGLVLALLALAALALMDVAPAGRWRRPRTWRWPVRTLAATALMLTLLSPWLLYQQRLTGYPLTDIRLLLHVQRLFPSVHLPVHPYQPAAAPPELTSPPATAMPPVAAPAVPSLYNRLDRVWTQLVRELLLGFFPPYLVFALAVLWQRWRARQLTRIEWSLLAIIAVHTLLLLAATPSWTQRRYLMPAIALSLGWTALGVQQLGAWLRHRYPHHGKRLVWAGATLALAGLLANGYASLLLPPTAFQTELLQARRTAAAWLLQHGMDRVPPDAPRLRTWAWDFHNGRLPVVAGMDPYISYFAGTDKVRIDAYPEDARRPLSELIATCRASHVHYLVWDWQMAQRYPQLADLEHLSPEFAVCAGDWRNAPPNAARVILAFQPNLLPEKKPDW